MPKAILEFNLPEDGNEFKLATDGGKLFGILWDLDQKLRSIVKYDNLTPHMMDMKEEEVKEEHKIGATGLADWLRTYLRELGYSDSDYA